MKVHQIENRQAIFHLPMVYIINATIRKEKPTTTSNAIQNTDRPLAAANIHTGEQYLSKRRTNDLKQAALIILLI